MAIGVGATSKGRTGSATSQATTGVTTQGSGSTFVIGIAWADSTITLSSLVDSKGNTYTQIGSDTPIDGTNNHARFYRCENGTGGASHTATVTLSAATSIEIFFLEITGAATASFDQTNQQKDTASPYTSGAITPTQAASMLVALFFGNSGSNPATHAESTGFTIQTGAEETNGASFWTGCMATRIVSSIASYNCSFTESGSSSAAVFIANFKEAAGGGGGTPAARRSLLGVGI